MRNRHPDLDGVGMASDDIEYQKMTNPLLSTLSDLKRMTITLGVLLKRSIDRRESGYLICQIWNIF